LEAIFIILGAWLVIWLIIELVKLLIKFTVWFSPLALKGMIIVLGLGCLIGIPIGIYYGIKCYMTSINKNISNKTLKVLMIIITSTTIMLIFTYAVIIVAYYLRYYNFW